MLEPPQFRSIARFALLSFLTFFLLPADLSTASAQLRQLIHFYVRSNFATPITWYEGTDLFEYTPSDLSDRMDFIHEKVGKYMFLLTRYLSGFFFLHNCALIFLLSTYYSARVYDVYFPLQTHFELMHKYVPDFSEHREEQYWEYVNSSPQARYLFEFFWGLRIGVGLIGILYFETTGAIGHLLYYTVKLSFAIFHIKEPANSVARFMVHCVISWVTLPSDPHYLAIIFFQTIGYDVFRRCVIEPDRLWLTWLNELPCALCEDIQQDIKITTLPADANVLGRFREEMCRHCWGPWTKGQKIAVLACGHVYHASCCDEWFRTAGSMQCPMCRFDVSARDYQRANRVRRKIEEAEFEAFKAEQKDSSWNEWMPFEFLRQRPTTRRGRTGVVGFLPNYGPTGYNPHMYAQ